MGLHVPTLTGEKEGNLTYQPGTVKNMEVGEGARAGKGTQVGNVGNSYGTIYSFITDLYKNHKSIRMPNLKKAGAREHRTPSNQVAYQYTGRVLNEDTIYIPFESLLWLSLFLRRFCIWRTGGSYSSWEEG
jgi:hypothetical protein